MISPQPHLSHPKYRPDIDGLRAIAVLSVVAFHAFPTWVKGGFIGVDVFFVISGYLISTIIFENLDKGIFSFAEFYARRIKRIFPALLIVLIASYAFGWLALFADEYKQLGKHIAAGAGFVSNIVLWNEAGYFDNSAETKPLLHLWSLGIEEQYYIVWPMLLWLAWKRKFNLLTITILVSFVSFYLNIVGIEKDTVATFYSPQTRFWELLSGSFLAWVTLYRKEAYCTFKGKLDGWLMSAVYCEKPDAAAKTLPNALSFVGLLLLAYGFWRINRDFNFPGMWAVVPVLGSVLIISAGPNAWVNRTLLSSKVAVWFGLISFPLYLWHWPLIAFARIIESEVPSRSIRIGAVVVSVALAWITYKLVEQPMRLGEHSKAKVMTLLVVMVIVGCVGYNTYSGDGYPFRSSIKNFVNNKSELEKNLATDNHCLNYIKNKSPLFPYCRFSNVGSAETIAVVGDSHALAAYPGISEYLQERGINTVLLANSGCPPFLGAPFGKNGVERQACSLRINELLETLLSREDIRKVFFFTRGPIYITGTEPVTGNLDLWDGNNLALNDFVRAAQQTFAKLALGGKRIFYITENPELSNPAVSCIVRPLRVFSKDCRPDKIAVLSRQDAYLDSFGKLTNVTVVDSLKAFCPDEKCVVFENGSLLYADDNHLSVAGSRFQVKHLLSDFLN